MPSRGDSVGDGMGKKTWENQFLGNLMDLPPRMSGNLAFSGEFDGCIYQEPLENLGFSWEFDGFNQQIMGKEAFDGQTCDFNE